MSPLTTEDAASLARCVEGGGVAVFPTDTVYGICCDPDDARAARRIYELKGRPPERPSAVMFFALDAALATLDQLDARTRAAVAALLPGPVTLLLANPHGRFAPACGPQPHTLGVRVPRLPASLGALGAIELPLLQTSANLSGGADARRLEQVPPALREGADLVLDGGELAGTPSTVIDLRDYGEHARHTIVREGALSAAEVDALLARLG